MQIKTHITKRDWVRFRLFHLLHSPATRYQSLAWICLPPFAAAGLLFGFLAWLAPAPVSWLTSALPSLITLPLFLALFYHIKKRSLRYQLEVLLKVGNGSALLGDFSVSLSEEGVTAGRQPEGTFWPWREIKSVVANGDYGYIYTGDDEAFIIPRDAFTEDESFRIFMKSAVIYHFHQEQHAADSGSAIPASHSCGAPELLPQS
jgi:hypothetical protein